MFCGGSSYSDQGRVPWARLFFLILRLMQIVVAVVVLIQVTSKTDPNVKDRGEKPDHGKRDIAVSLGSSIEGAHWPAMATTTDRQMQLTAGPETFHATAILSTTFISVQTTHPRLLQKDLPVLIDKRSNIVHSRTESHSTSHPTTNKDMHPSPTRVPALSPWDSTEQENEKSHTAITPHQSDKPKPIPVSTPTTNDREKEIQHSPSIKSEPQHPSQTAEQAVSTARPSAVPSALPASTKPEKPANSEPPGPVSHKFSDVAEVTALVTAVASVVASFSICIFLLLRERRRRLIFSPLLEPFVSGFSFVCAGFFAADALEGRGFGTLAIMTAIMGFTWTVSHIVAAHVMVVPEFYLAEYDCEPIGGMLCGFVSYPLSNIRKVYE